MKLFSGKKPMENVHQLSYLGAILSSDGKNMKTILQKKLKQIGKKKQITNLIRPLGKYTFECAVIFWNSLVRNSVLYGTEAMTHLNEKEIRELERIEEDQMRNIMQVKTGIQVPLHLMYLDLGQTPARYQIYRYKMNFLQYILHQKEESLLSRMLYAQQIRPVRGDWFSGVRQIMEDMHIIMKIEDIKNMSRREFRNLTKLRCEEAAFSDLISKRNKGSKGRYLSYEAKLEMSDYLCPNNQLTVDDQRLIFQIRNQSNPLPANRGDPQPCFRGCGEIQDNCHIVECSLLDKEERRDYNLIINGTFNEMKNNLEQWKKNLNIIEAMDSVL
jgi:hypothetical protein